MNIPTLIKSLLLPAALLLALSACGKSGSNSNHNPLIENHVQSYEKTTSLSGSVSGAAEPVQSGRVNATNETGAILATAGIQNGHFSISIPAGTKLPVILKAHAENTHDAIGTLEAVAVDAALKKYDINPLSTAIAAKARQLGGFSRENMTEAAMTSIAPPDANKTTGGFRGDPTKQYGGWH